MNANLKAKLASYSIVGSAFLIHCKIANAQVICNDYIPDLIADDGHVAYVDLNNDGYNDFRFKFNQTSTFGTCMYCSGTAMTTASVSLTESYFLAGAHFQSAICLDFGDTIDANIQWNNWKIVFYKYITDWDQDTSITNVAQGTCFPSNADKYLPVLMIENYQNHYGWIKYRLDGWEIIIEETGFNLTPDSPILAGQCDYALSTPKLPPTDQVKMNFYDNNLSLKISDLQFEQGELRVYNTEAQTILATDRISSGNNFNFQMYPAGLYYAFYRKNDKVFVLKFAKQ